MIYTDKLSIEYSDGVLTVFLKGEIDHHKAVSVRAGIDAAIYENLPSRLILELSGVEFCDSSGLGLIIGRYTKAKSIGAVFELKNPGDRIVRLLSVVGLDRLIAVTNDEAKGSVRI